MLRVASTLLCLLFCSSVSSQSMVGINYGREGTNLPSPFNSIELIKSMNASGVKLYDADPETLKLLSNSKMHVSIMVPNNKILEIASSQASASQWVRDNVLQYYPGTMIRYILVGNEVLSFQTDQDKRTWDSLVPAMRMINNCLRANNIRNIKIGTPLAMDVVETTFPPSYGRFRADIADTVMPQLLKFINGTNSFFFIDVYPYFPWSQNPDTISLMSALLSSDRQIQYRDPGSDLTYTNLLDQMLDSLIFAMAKLGFFDIKLFISETGWPNEGDVDHPGANITNAATYNRNVIRKMTSVPPVGTPARAGVAIPTFLFSLYDEDKKVGAATERHWGLCDSTGLPHYGVDLSGRETLAPIPVANNTSTVKVLLKRKVWCVANEGADRAALERGLRFACRRGNGTCSAIMLGRECHRPLSLARHASYAFSAYWAMYQPAGASCSFDGAAKLTTRDPSFGLCRFPSINL